MLGMIALQIACLGWSVGSSYSKRHGRSENVFSATAAQMLAGGVMMLVLGTLRGEWGSLAFSTRTGARVRLSRDGRRHRRVRRLHVCAAAPAGVAGFAVRLHQPGDCGRARRRGARRAVHVAHGDRRRTRVRRRGHRARAPRVNAGAHARQASDVQTRRPLISRTRKSTMATTSRT